MISEPSRRSDSASRQAQTRRPWALDEDCDMTDAPTSAGRRRFSGTAVLVVVGIILVVMCAIVVVLSQRDVTRAMDERSDVALEFENVSDEAQADEIESEMGERKEEDGGDGGGA